jgi:hypothetical protein
MLTKTLKFSPDVLTVLRNMTWNDDGTIGYLHGQLDRKLYVDTNKALDAMGGKWNKGKKGHVFAFDPRPQVEGLLDSGTLTVERDGFFETPKAVVDRMVSLVWPCGDVLEPSAGMGAIVDNLPNGDYSLACVEKNANRVNALREKGYVVHCMDFLQYDETTFDTIFMNPPFEESQDIAHVMHAYSLLNDDGKMVAIMGEGAFFREDKKAAAFREWLDSVGGWSEQLPDGSFKESGTGVATRIVVIEK